MKKLLLIVAVAFASVITANAQFGAGINVALPLGNIGDVVGIGVGATANYDVAVSDNLTVGGESGLIYFLPKTVDFGIETKTSAIMIPIQGVVKYHLSATDESGLYLGGALGLHHARITTETESIDVGFFTIEGGSATTSSTDVSFAPIVGFKTEGGLDLQARYQIIDGGAYLGLRVGKNF